MVRLFDIVASGKRRVLLLQGPVGPFFCNLAHDLRHAGASVFKINFNGGDWLFYPSKATHFRQSLNEWPPFLEQFLIGNQIDLILCFGDCRPIHLAARTIATKLKVELGVFEEGYVRPNHITLERYGVNAHSRLSKDPSDYIKAEKTELAVAIPVRRPFLHAMVWAMLYNIAGTLLRPVFRNYQHHRNLTISDSLYWFRSLWRKWIYAANEMGILEKLIGELAGRYFLIPLQVAHDSQIQSHSKFVKVEEFIEEVMRSFAEFAPPDTLLVIKQHPLERGHKQYSSWIDRLTKELDLSKRVLYIHDQHLPTLLSCARGVVVINSTVGLSAIHHGIPLKNLGEAIYDIPGLTYQGELNDFWSQAPKPMQNLYESFYNRVIKNTQINGNFYRRLPIQKYRSGVRW